MNLHSSRPRRTRLGRAGLFSLAGLASILVPMAPAGSASVPSGPPAGFKAVDAGPIVQAIDATSDRIFADFNRRDRDAYVAAFTRDAFIMPPGAGLQTGHVGAAEGYMRAPGGLMYAGLQWKDRRCFRIGPWWIDTGLVALKFRLNVDAPEMSDPRSALTIWEEGADHALRVKVLAWNPLPSAPQFDGEPALAFEPATTPAPLSTTGDFKPVLEAEVAFHRAIEERKYADAAAYYAPQALLLPPGTAPARGQAAIRRHLEGNPAEHPVIRIDRTVAHVEGNADFVLVVNLFRWTFSPANGSAAATVSGKGVHLWQRDADGGWRILFDLPNPSQRSPE